MAEIPPREALTVGSRIWFEEERLPYTVRGITSDRRWVICTKPFAARHTVLYTVIDFDREVRGVDDRVLGFGYETDEDCAMSLGLFEEGIAAHSRRNPPIPLKIRKTEVHFAALRDGGTE